MEVNLVAIDFMVMAGGAREYPALMVSLPKSMMMGEVELASLDRVDL